MRYRLYAPVLMIALLSVPAAADDQDITMRRSRAFDFVVSQRNTAMDSVAACAGELQYQVEELKKQLEQAKKACPAPKQ